MRRFGSHDFWLPFAATLAAGVTLLALQQLLKAVVHVGVRPALVVVAALLVVSAATQSWRALRRRSARAEARAEDIEKRLAAVEGREPRLAERVAKLEAAAVGEVARAAIIEGWTVKRADPKTWGDGWFEFTSPKGDQTLNCGIETESELAAMLRDRTNLLLPALRDFRPLDDWSSANLWRARKDRAKV